MEYLIETWAESLDMAGRELVALVGAGGKTALAAALSWELRLAGQRVVIAPTTRMYRPPDDDLILAPDEAAARDALRGRPGPGEAVHLGRAELVKEGVRPKIVGHPPEVIGRLWDAGAAEYFLVEADGAKGRPLKAPRDHEPVVPAQSTLVVGVLGLGGLGKPLDEDHVFAVERFAAISGLRPGQTVTPEAAAEVVLSPLGLFKNAPAEAAQVLFLNQADLPGARRAGLELAQILAQRFAGLRIVIGSAQVGSREIVDLP